MAGARGLHRPARGAAAAPARLPDATRAAGREQPGTQHPRQLLDPVLAGGGARHPGRAARRLLGRRHHRLPPAPGLRVDGRRAGALSAFPEDHRAGLARQGAEAPPQRQRAAGQCGGAGAQPRVDRQLAGRQAARPQRLQGLRQRRGRPRSRMDARGRREPAPGRRVRGHRRARPTANSGTWCGACASPPKAGVRCRPPPEAGRDPYDFRG